LIFCEVKMRSRLDFGRPVEMVDEEQEDRLRRAASLWLAANPRHAGLETSFDIIGVHGGRLERFESVF
jgi:Holliday junction resolvase-like predicted endonuclease